jgi:adenosine deaminase
MSVDDDVQSQDFKSRVLKASGELPKAELHLHIDGSLSPSFISRRAAARGILLPCKMPDDIRATLIAEKISDIDSGEHIQNIGGNWSCFDWCNRLLQSIPELEDATFELAETLFLEFNCWVVELRFCPALHTLEDLDEEGAVAAVVRGFQKAENMYPMLRGGIILCALRSMDVTHFDRTFLLAKQWLGSGVIGADVAGDEKSYPLEPFVQSLQRAVSWGVPMTVHAGEWVPQGDVNLVLAVSAGASRIGHALILEKSELALRSVMAANVAVEVCITSNLGDRESKCSSYRSHPVRYMLDQGVRVAGFNSDNLLLSGTSEFAPTPTAEVSRAVLECGLDMNIHVRSVLTNALFASFDSRVSGDHEEAKLYRDAFTKQMDGVLKTFGFT